MALHSYILHNDRIVGLSTPDLCAGQLGLLAGWGVFSTLRVRDGRLFAWERHWARMQRDAQSLHVEIPCGIDAAEERLLRLIAANGARDCTLRVAVVRNGGGMWEDRESGRGASDLIALTADSKKWPATVRLSMQPNARFAANEFAGAKILSWAQNLTWAERAQQSGFDETILLNEYGRVAECTSANIFAIFGNDVWTPPLSEGCLPGITREILLWEVRIAGVGISERPLSAADLHQADSVFITSTTRDLKRVAEIADTPLVEKGDVRERLDRAFSDFLALDIARRSAVVAI